MPVSDDGWRKSTWCAGGECLEARGWRKARRSVQNGACLEAAGCAHGIAVRDSADPSGPVLAWSAEAWTAFTSSLKAA